MEGVAENQNKKDGILNRILDKYRECNDISILEIAIYHLGIYDKYLKLLQEKGQAAFPNRLEYQKFQVSKLFIDKLNVLEFSLDPSLKGFKEYKDCRLAPLDAFNMTPDIKETRKIKFCRNIEKGDLLHLKVVEEGKDDYKFLVINKYNENERVADYFIYAYMVKTPYLLSKLPEPMRINDLIRATVFGKLKMEGNVFSKLLVTFTTNMIRPEYKDVKLGKVHKSEIPFYPEDISNYSTFLDYMKADKSPDDPQEMLKCMSSLGINPYKIYSFHEPDDGKKLGNPKEPSTAVELKTIEKSMNLIRDAEELLLRGADHKFVLPMLEKAIEICPNNDAAYAVRGQLYKSIFIKGNDFDLILKALDDFEKALAINCYNLIATREYLTLLVLSAELHKDEGDTAKSDSIREIVKRCKEVCDVTQILNKDISDEKES